MELGNFSVSLAVKDIEASKRFYDKLGFAVRCCVIRLVHTRPKLSLWKIASSAAGIEPAHRIWESEDFLAFLSTHPRNPGQTCLIPKMHIEYVRCFPVW